MNIFQKRTTFTMMLLSLFSISIFAQTNPVVGEYSYYSESNDGMSLTVLLDIQMDGNYSFNYEDDQLCYVTRYAASGRWELKEGVIHFTIQDQTHSNGMEEFNYSLTLAVLKNRDIQFTESDKGWLNNMLLKKK